MFDQAEALIKHWLRQPPAADRNTFVEQCAQALWLEDRHHDFLIRLMGARRT